MIEVNKNFHKKIFIASDHAGFELKKFIISELSKNNLNFEDLGCDSSEKSVDYPDFAQKLCKEIISENEVGILICGSGVGISIASNRFKNIRAALCHNPEIAKLSRSHNNANVVCLGSRIISQETALEIINCFFNTNFEAGRHEGRIKKLTK